MAEKITDYTAKSQNFIDTDLFDVSKHVTQTSGVLVVGKRYTILDFNAGDNFTNVASVVSGTINTTGCVFDAIGTTPTTYSNGSTLARYETQSYTYADLKAVFGLNYKSLIFNFSQTSTNDPVFVDKDANNLPFLNTTGATFTFPRTGAGVYDLTSSIALFDKNKFHMGVFHQQQGGTRTWFIPLIGATGLEGYIYANIVNDFILRLRCIDSSLTPADISTVIGSGNPISFPEIKIFG